jgi:hypothetical protein
MACFLVSAAEAAVVKAVKKHEEKVETQAAVSESAVNEAEVEPKIPMSRKLKWLTRLLIGGAVLLAFEHVWHGEVVPWFTFLTAMSDPADTAEMLHEMATVGVSMAVLITAVWFVMCKVADALVKKPVVEPEKTIA